MSKVFLKEKSDILEAPVRQLEKHLRSTYSDNQRHKPVLIPDDMPPKRPPKYQMDLRPPMWKEVANTLKQAKIASAPGHNCIPYRL